MYCTTCTCTTSVRRKKILVNKLGSSSGIYEVKSNLHGVKRVNTLSIALNTPGNGQ